MGEVRHGSVSAHRYHGCRCDVCVAAKRERDREYYLRNRDRVKATTARYRAENPEKVRESQRRYRETHAEELAALEAAGYTVDE